jgi:hypothetical protein
MEQFSVYYYIHIGIQQEGDFVLRAEPLLNNNLLIEGIHRRNQHQTLTEVTL